MKTPYEAYIALQGMLTKYAYRFHDTFDADLWSYLDLITGFDIVAFDHFLGVPDDISMKAYIEDEYGKDAMPMIEELVKFMPSF